MSSFILGFMAGGAAYALALRIATRLAGRHVQRKLDTRPVNGLVEPDPSNWRN